ncbi:MAG: hypothetical protein KKD46_06110 [Euryarchaeota archaeon]|nr:hypothetical protein [Euryarchaeota archaeon]MBU4340472.1 hypothetical protein [Euryarchaeota archaeon]MBU4454273.1 hypothetical protein [Euryarchaeota archaeon]MCG2736725.1 hypothetical protein [Candidatus Methanoperedenaceae archaeon]
MLSNNIFVLIALMIVILAGAADAAPLEEWNRTYGGARYEFISNLQQTADRGYIISGNNMAEGWLMKTDDRGNVQWKRTYSCTIRFLQQTVDMGYIGVGDFCIFKTNGDGSILWNRTHNGLTRWVFQTQDGGYIAAGNIVDSDSHFRAWLLRTDAGGIELWNRTFRAPGTTSSDFGNFFQRTPDGGYLLDVSSVLFKIDANGNELWNRTIKPAYYPYYVLQTRDGGYVMTGSIGDEYWLDAWLARTDAEFNIQFSKQFRESKPWSRKFEGARESHAVQQTRDGGYIFGSTRFSAEGSDVWLTKFESDMNLSSIPWASPVYSPGELRNGTEIPVKYRNDIGEGDIKTVLDAAAREIRTFDGSRYESIRANLSLAGGSLRDNIWVKQFLFEFEGYRDGRKESWQIDLERPEKGTNTSVIRVLGGCTLVPDNYLSIAESIAFRKLENESLNRTPELADASWIINRPGIVVLIFKDPESPANADVKVDLRNRSVESVEKKYWFQPSFPIYFNITSNPEGVDVYLAKGGLGDLCGGPPYKLGGDLIGKTPLTYKYEYNQTFMPFSGLFSLFSFNLAGYEDTFKCINIYGGENASKLSVSIHKEGSLEPVSEAPLTYNISAGLKPKKKINIDVPGFEFVFPIGAFLLIYLLGSRKVS